MKFDNVGQDSALQIHGNLDSHPVVKELRQRLAVQSIPCSILVASAAEYVAESASGRTNELLKKGTAVLLVDAKEASKKALINHIGLGIPGDAIALLISAEKAPHDRLTYVLHELSEELYSEAVPVEVSTFEMKLLEESAPKAVEELSVTQQEMPAPSREAAFVDGILTALVKPSAVDMAATSGDQPPQQKWIFNKTLDWSCPKGDKSHGHTPQPQATKMVMTFTFTAYLDSQDSGQFQWLYLNLVGYQTVGATGMNQNYGNQRGWANGAVQVKATTPTGFFINQCSPTNTNNAQTVTSSVSFTVGMDSDGGSASYQVSNSTSEVITDWAVKLQDVNNWLYYQQNPWNGTTTKASGDMASYDTLDFAYKLKPLPNLSTGVMDFCTMSVWNNQKVTKNTIDVPVYIYAKWNYLGLKNTWPLATTTLWYYTNSTTLHFSIDMSKVS